MTTMSRSRRLRSVLLAVLLGWTAFGVETVPTAVPLPRPEALTPAPTLALACADGPAFKGRLTSSKTSTVAVTRSTSGNVYGYISEVVDDWSCTAYYRYDGLGYRRLDADGNFDWGNMINSTSVPCNWVIGSTNYLKGNSTNDCADSDAEYALPIHFDKTSGGALLETIAHQDTDHDDAGDFFFIHSDCTSYYGGESIKYGKDFASGTVGNRPGSNCDPRDIDGTNTSQSIVLDSTPPTLAFTAPAGTAGTVVGAGSTTYGVTFNPADNVADFGSTHPWSLQRQITTNTGAGTCGAFFNDTAAGNLVTGTTEGSQTNNQTLVAAKCYRWILSASDMNGNVATPLTSATVIVDLTAPTTSFGNPPSGSTISRNTTAFSVAWTETEANSGIASRSLQRQRVSATSSACPGTFTNDGSAVTTTSPSSQTLTSGYCYLWKQTLTDKAGNATTTTSNQVYVNTSVPMADFSTPDEGTTTYQSSTSLSVAWTETAGTGTVTARSLQRFRESFGSGACPATPYADDPTEGNLTSTSPVAATLTAGYCYQWVQTLTNSGGKVGATTSGVVIVDATSPSGTISYPETNRPLAGTVTITGTASDAGSFKDYQLEYGAGASPGSWTSLGVYTSAVASDGPLADWETGSLSGVYTLRLTVRENASSTTSVTTRTVYLENARRGDEAFYTRVPFELGGGYTLDVGVANGEARLSRDLFSIPSYGPEQALSLTSSSLETGTLGQFGAGWSSNLTQYLTFDVSGGVTVWHRADGGRLPFGLVASVWTPLRGHHETMTSGSGEVSITTPDQTTYVFDDSGAGRLKRISNRFGSSLTLAWSTSSATATDASGRVTNISIDSGNGRITGVTDSAGRAWAFGYTGSGTSSDLTSITDPESEVTTLTYTSHALTSVSRSRSRASGSPQTVAWTIAYSSGKAVSIDDPEATTANTFTYGASSTDVAMIVDDDTSTIAHTIYGLDDLGLGRVTSMTDALGNVTSRVFDADSNLTSQAIPTEEDGTAVTSYTYDARGNVLSQTDPIDATTDVVTVSTYSASNDLLTRTEADNDDDVRTVTKYTYDGSGHLDSMDLNCTSSGTTIPAEGAGGSCTGAGTEDASTNILTSFAYDANDQLEFEQDPLGRVTKHVYDSDGNETSTISDCTSSGTTLPSPFDTCTAAGTHDGATNVTTSATFDVGTTAGQAGLATTTTDALGRDTDYAYDDLGRQLTEVGPGDASIPALTRSTTWDELGNPLTEVETWTPSGASLQTRTTTHVYDLAQRETSLTDPAGVETLTTYDQAGNEIETVSGGVTTLRAFDLLGRSTSERLVDEGGPETSQTYTTLGAPRLTLSAANIEVEQTTTFSGAVKEESVNGTLDLGLPPLTTIHEYDVLGRETKVTDPDGHITTTTYDRLGRLLSSEIDGSATYHAYDRAGNEVTMTDPEGTVTTTTYDRLDRPATVIGNDVASPTSPTEDITSHTYYDATGATIAIEDARGITTRMILNAAGQVSETIANCTDTGTTPTTDPAACTGGGTHNDGANIVTEMTYDGQGAVVMTVSAVGRPAEATTETAYDEAGRVQASKDPLGTISRSKYNADGQLTDTYLNCTTTGTTIPTDWANCSGAGTANGTYNLHTTYTYDDHGNQASVTAPNGRITTTVYDDADRVIATIDNYVNGVPGTTDDVTTETYYDDYGRAVAVRTPTATGSSTIVTRSILNDDGTVASVIRNCTTTGTTTPLDADVLDCAGGGDQNAETNVTTNYVYDDRGNRIRQTEPDPAATSGTSTATVTTQYAYDIANRLCRVVENATGSTDLQALADPCATATQTAATTTTNVSTRYTYDGAGNLATMIDADGHTTTYGYDAAGHSTSRTDALGKTIVWAYDDLGNQIRQENRSDPPYTDSIVWTHDAAGRILTRTADSATTTYTYDLNGNKLSASDGTLTINATYDRTGRALTVDDEDAGTTPDTTYTYSLTSPAWTDPTGSYGVTLDKFDRATALDDPVMASDFTWTYRADGQPSVFGQPNGNATDLTYDALGHLTGSDDDTSGGTDRAVYGYTYNRAGQILTEASTVTGDPTNGTISYAYDPLGRLASSTLSSVTTLYGWDAVPNRTSVKVGAGATATTSYDAANRPTSGTNPTTSYSSDDDGRLTARPNQTLLWDDLGRLTTVKNAAGSLTLATYTYDPLDRLRMVDYGAGVRIRFRYVGLTTAVAQWIDDATGTVTRSVGTGWGGERLLDWTGSGSNIRIYGQNGHHDVTWLASNTGSVSQSLRYDPWGNPRATVPTGYTPFRFQGSYYDDTTDLSWVVTRWYAPALGTFISEDSLLGEPADPPSRHLYAYGMGEPLGRWDPDGRWFRHLRAVVEAHDCFPCTGILLTRLQLDVRWDRYTMYGRSFIANYYGESSAAWHREGYNIGPIHIDTGGWFLASPSTIRVTAGGKRSTFVTIKVVQGFGYAGVFSAGRADVFYNRFSISVTARANGSASCAFETYAKRSPALVLGYQFTRPTCRFE